MFPLGGPGGKPLTITALGGNLRKPIAKVVTLPDTPGILVDPGPFDGPDGAVAAPMMVMVGEAKEFREPQAGDLAEAPGPAAVDASGGAMPESFYSILLAETSNGAIGRRGEVDRYVMTVKKGEKFRIRVVAEPMGSWLDSVLTVRDKDGNVLGENDDSSLNPEMQGRRGVNFLGVAQESSDSLLDFEARADGPITIEVTDRYGEGGPEYGYRMAVGTSRPDFAVYVLIGNPNANGQVFTAANNRSVMLAPGVFGVYNLVPGVKVPVNFLVVPQGRPGPVSVRVEGLPEGVSAVPVKVDVLGPGPKGGSLSLVNAPAKAGNVVLDVAGYALPGVAEFRIVASAEPEPGKAITRTASATIGLEAVQLGRPRAADHAADRPFPAPRRGRAKYSARRAARGAEAEGREAAGGAPPGGPDRAGAGFRRFAAAGPRLQAPGEGGRGRAVDANGDRVGAVDARLRRRSPSGRPGAGARGGDRCTGRLSGLDLVCDDRRQAPVDGPGRDRPGARRGADAGPDDRDQSRGDR